MYGLMGREVFQERYQFRKQQAHQVDIGIIWEGAVIGRRVIVVMLVFVLL